MKSAETAMSERKHVLYFVVFDRDVWMIRFDFFYYYLKKLTEKDSRREKDEKEWIGEEKKGQ